MKYRRLLSAFFIFLAPVLSHAEYRVFLLKIGKQGSEQGFRLVESTLDPEQYRSFYPVALDESISYIATWRCYGRTDGMRPHCPNPKGQIPSEASPAP